MAGVQKFMDLVKQRCAERTKIYCPCTTCLNRELQYKKVVEEHLLMHGMSATYTRWTHHGESENDPVDEFSQQLHGYDDHDAGTGFEEYAPDHVDVVDVDLLTVVAVVVAVAKKIC